MFCLRLFLRYCQCSHEYIHVLRIETAKISFLEQLLKASSVHCFPRDKDDLTAEMILLAVLGETQIKNGASPLRICLVTVYALSSEYASKLLWLSNLRGIKH